MKKTKYISLFLSIIIFIQASTLIVRAKPEEIYTPGVILDTEFDCSSVILMEATTGKVLFEQNADAALPPASVTKIMTLLLVMEAIDEGKIKLTDTVTASAHACSMGGSQIYLKEGEEMSVEDLLKSVVIASANDAAVALAEHLDGSEELFVKRMNEKAKFLGMNNTNFENTNGLDDTATNHVTSAKDIAIMSRELIKHKTITEYSSIWMDTIRNGEFGLTNTNRLVRFYKGATGLKTGSTSKAGFCISATATRENMTLICVIMAAPTRDVRNQIAKQILDWGFSNFSLYSNDGKTIENIYVKGGKESHATASYSDFYCVVESNLLSKIKQEISINEELCAPINKDTKIGSVVYKADDKVIGTSDICIDRSIEKITFLSMVRKIASKIIFSY